MSWGGEEARLLEEVVMIVAEGREPIAHAKLSSLHGYLSPPEGERSKT